MTYTYRAKRQNLDALNLRRQIAAAEVEAAERELAEINNAEIELQHLGIRREQLHYELKQARGRANLTTRRVALPPPVYGGREGLLAATKEAEGWDTRRKQHKQRSPPMSNTTLRILSLGAGASMAGCSPFSCRAD